MVFFTLTDTPASDGKSLQLDHDRFLVEQEYPAPVGGTFLAEAQQWCVESFLHYHKEDLDYNYVESYEEIKYMPIAPREIVICEGRVFGFIRWIGGYNTSRTIHSNHVGLLMIDPVQRKPLFNLVDQHTSERFDNDIYYRYTLMRRNELPQGKQVEQQCEELVNVIF